jgi:hypothetical protein
MTAIGSATSGVLNAISRFDAAAQQTVSALDVTSPIDPVGPVINQITAVAQMKASVKVLKTADAMQKTALDILV